MDNNKENNKDVEFLDATPENNNEPVRFNNPSATLINTPEQSSNTVINPNAYHPSLNQNNMTNSNLDNNIKRPDPVPIYKDEKRSKVGFTIGYIILVIAYYILGLSLFVTIGTFLLVSAFSLLFHDLSSIPSMISDMWLYVLINIILFCIINSAIKKRNINKPVGIRNIVTLSVIYDIFNLIFRRRR